MIKHRVLWITAFGSMLPGGVLSDPPIPFGGWSVNSGIVTAGCAGGAQCDAPIVIPGMFQREISSSNGRYIQSILTDTGANGLPGTLPFSSESFVVQGGFSSQSSNQKRINDELVSSTDMTSNSGISVRQEINDPERGFFSDVTLNTGAASVPGKPSMEINQQLLAPFDADMSITSRFSLLANMDTSGNRTGFRLVIDQQLDGSIAGTSGGWEGSSGWGDGSWGGGSGSTSRLTFAHREVAGDMLITSGSASVGGTGDRRTSRTDGDTVSWSPGDNVSVVWVGQPEFGFQAYDNLSDSRDRITTVSVRNPGPFSWFDPPFGPKPSLPSGSSGDGGGGVGW